MDKEIEISMRVIDGIQRLISNMILCVIQESIIRMRLEAAATLPAA